MTLRHRAERAVRDALARIPATTATHTARATLEAQLPKLTAPLRIAVAGRVSSGKSTLVNALIGAPVALTGSAPLTLVVSVLRHGDRTALTVHHKDGPPTHLEGIGRIEEFTARGHQAEKPRPVDHVEVFGPHACLRQFDLVDTPGFDSPYAQDTQEAMRALGVDRESVAAASAAGLRGADAVIAVLNSDVTAPDADVLRRFHDADGTGFSPTPVTSIGVLTKVELLWPGEIGQPVDDPRDTARKHARRIMASAHTARMFHDVRPLCGLLAAGAAAFHPEDDFEALHALTGVPQTALDLRLSHLSGFVSATDLPLPADRRRRLAGLFTPYGVSLACRLLREGVDRPAVLRRELEERSGITALRRELTERFAARSDLIKAARMIEEIRGLPVLLAPDTSDRDRDLVVRAVEAITGLEHSEPAFMEFDLLLRHYTGRLRLSESDARELERVTGERGSTVAARLGLAPETGLAALERAALDRLAHWNGPRPPREPGGRAVAHVLKRRYDEVYHRLRRARALLDDVPAHEEERAPAAPAPLPDTPGPVDGGPAGGEPVLVVDLGTTTSSAILLGDGRTRLLKEPGTGRDWWPTAVYDDGQLLVGSVAEARRAGGPDCFRAEFKPEIGSPVPVLRGPGGAHTAEDLAVAVLAAFRRRTAPLPGGVPSRLLVTVPARTTGRRRDAMIRAGERAGFTDVELLEEPVAAALAPSDGGPWPPGSTVLVYDLGGGTFDAALVGIGETGHTLLGTAGLADGHGGRDIDAAIVRDLTPAMEDWLRAAPEHAAHRDQLAHLTLRSAIRLKHGLAAEDCPVETVVPGMPPQSLSRKRLGRLTEELLADSVVCCRTLLAETGVDPRDVDVLLVGGSTQMPSVRPYLERRLGTRVPVRSALDPVLAVVEGAVTWAEGIPQRRIAADGPSSLRAPLSWTLPGGRATLVRWFTAGGAAYRPDAALARVRLADNTLFDLRARTGGRVEQHHVWPGDTLYSGTWLVTALRPAGPGDLLPRPREVLRSPGVVTALAVAPDGRHVAVAVREGPEGSVLRLLDALTGETRDELRIRGRVLSAAWSCPGTWPVFGVSGGELSAHGVYALAAPAVGGASARLRQLAEQPAAVLALEQLPGGREVVVLGGDGVLRGVDMTTGRDRAVAELWHRPTVLAVRGDGEEAVVAGGRGHRGVAYFVNLADGKLRSSTLLPAQVRALASGPHMNVLAGGGTLDDQGRARYLGRDEELVPPNAQEVRGVAISHQGALSAAVAVDGQAWVGGTQGRGTWTHLRYPDTPVALAFSPDGHYLHIAGDAGLSTWALTEAHHRASDEPAAPTAPRQEPTSHDT
ncbi:Hsp70 family protein [Streptomyces sp. AN091965]|uniref:Hsp70 family protein n=1 Tax=Streptomyces sp. AN091965 TaxID=2927803 RepID=UPI001F60CB62|nr:Hsp70 family protein [Streptomyces sp. AN091965]MCI3935041.1 Hsp70 family protein [Streptomyces sp. AN091965]